MDLGHLGLQMNYNTLNKHSGTTREGLLNRMEKSQVQRDAGTRLGHRAGQLTQLALEPRDPKHLAQCSVHHESFLLTLSVQQLPCSSTHIKAKPQAPLLALPQHLVWRSHTKLGMNFFLCSSPPQDWNHPCFPDA